MKPKRRERLFISYSRKDSKKALKLYERLAAAGFKPWIDQIDIMPGEDWKRAITVAIRGAAGFLALISKNSVSRRGVIQREILVALDELDQLLPSDVFIVPISIDGSHLPERLERLQAFEWSAKKRPDALYSAIRALLKQK